MLNFIWLGMIVVSVIVAFIEGRVNELVKACTDYAQTGFEIALSLAAIMTMWLGIMEVARQSGLVNLFARAVRPVMRWLFPDVPPDHPATGAMIMNIAANMLGIGNAATPFGLKAMEELQKLNQYKNQASDAMCTFLAVNTSSVQIIPITAINFLAINHATHPSDVVISALIATSISTAVAIISVKYLAAWPIFKVKTEPTENT
ncbi:nucleoside recognition domain-containing protein [Legionella sp. W05-934-2]|uniref:nucleoside recognition domain-containing protein n=1 Tax=Legionella sp. W05-934-2 TaxID=1198649 RepID=UPI0034618AEA